MSHKQTARIGAGKPGPGRPKGSVNKVTGLLKDAILAAADAAGGKDGLQGYLKKQANEQPAAFMAWLGKVLPMQVTGKDDGPILHQDVSALGVLEARLAAISDRMQRRALPVDG